MYINTATYQSLYPTTEIRIVKADEQKQSIKLFPFVKSKGNEALNGIDFDEEDYFRLVDWTGRAIRDEKKGSMPECLASIMERLNLNPESWLTSIKNYNRDYFTVVGAIDRIRYYAQMLEKLGKVRRKVIINS